MRKRGLQLVDFSYELPPDLIAQQPRARRDYAHLMVLDRQQDTIREMRFRQIGTQLAASMVLVLNDTRVIPARIQVTKETGKVLELLLIKQLDTRRWLALGSGTIKAGNRLKLPHRSWLRVIEKDMDDGRLTVELDEGNWEEVLAACGQTPLPPYIHGNGTSEQLLRQRYQTVYASSAGSVAAPTAGMHFTPSLLSQLALSGVTVEKVTLHVGPGTFLRLREKLVSDNHLHEENFVISQETAIRLTKAKLKGKKIVAVGTTTLRLLESRWDGAAFQGGSGTTKLFIYPPYRFGAVDHLITNFHVPQSSLLMLVAAFCSYPQTKTAFKQLEGSLLGRGYTRAIEKGYSFYSFGDAMLIL